MGENKKASYGAVPQNLEEANVTPEAYARRKRFRRSIFCTMGVLITVVFLGLMFAMLGGQVGVSKWLVYDALFSLDEMTLDSVESGCETTVVIARHCEKAGSETKDVFGNSHCSYIGYERAAYFATMFSDVDKSKYPFPAQIYALRADRGSHQNFREIEMVKPLAQKAGVAVNDQYWESAELAKVVLADIATGDMCGKTILISWKHEFIGKLARNLACHSCPRRYPNVFEPMWQLKYVYDVKGTDLYKSINRGLDTIAVDVIEPEEPVSPPAEPVDDGAQRKLRQLKKKKHKNKHRLPRNWSVYFSSQNQGFDPLMFSHSVGDYEGNAVAGEWSEVFYEGGEM
ncbi:unnamed protein product [Cylindrotheca closterium]|uniref:Uncharacterized protein n=1 Tax=Cylindrotheca closterium TaxID=2856 RepID=A0AAD2GDS1_9STRA|nr:unnamed protein product [Cylindrotheca closterium]